MTDDNWTLVQDAILAFNMKVPDLTQVRATLLKVLQSEAWKHYDPPIGKPCDYSSFEEWVRADVPRGLGTSVENVDLYRHGADSTFTNALDMALGKPAGAPMGNRNAAKDKTTVDNIHVCLDQPLRPTGTSESAALRRLRKDRPDLHAQVLDNELSAHAAAVQAGFRPKTFTVRADDPEKIAATLRRQLPEDVLKRVINHLEGW